MKSILSRILSFAFIVFFACSEQPSNIADVQPTVLLISLDGFWSGYFGRTQTPNLDRIAREGVKARWLIPQFPTKTFPNHYTIVTGLRPEVHGIVNNTIYDPHFDALFTLSDTGAVRDARWYGGEPLWVTAELQGQKAATYFWPGSEAAIKGVRPTYGKAYVHTTPDSQRVEEVLGWFDLSHEKRPTFLTLYFSLLDDAGHRFGPDSSAMLEVLPRADALIGYLVEGLETRGILDRINLIVVSDHGMVQTSNERVIFIDDYTDTSEVRIIDWSPFVHLWPKPGKEEAVYRRMTGAHPRLQVYRTAETPDRLHERDHPRIAPIIALADEGWSLSTRSFRRSSSGGNHGYDNALESMRAIFLARGPAFQQGIVVDPVENIHIYELICSVLNLKPAPNHGNLAAVKSLLRR
jgi:predicted AlkP superfamily pyrophosphatase or phosphodiesterase